MRWGPLLSASCENSREPLANNYHQVAFKFIQNENSVVLENLDHRNYSFVLLLLEDNKNYLGPN
jgi:hypothetical protein